MVILSLEQLAANPISSDTNPLRCPIPSSSGNIVIKESWGIPSDTMLSDINATHVDFSKSIMVMRQFGALSNHRLELLKFGTVFNGVGRCGQDHTSLLKCLCECFTKSHQSLTNLTTPTLEDYQENWLHMLLEKFINLSSLNMSNSPCTSFPSLERSFVKLLCLDISNTSISNLKGISNLPSLVMLHIRNLEFETAEDVEDVFELPNLRVLDASQDIQVILAVQWAALHAGRDESESEYEWEEDDEERNNESNEEENERQSEEEEELDKRNEEQGGGIEHQGKENEKTDEGNEFEDEENERQSEDDVDLNEGNEEQGEGIEYQAEENEEIDEGNMLPVGENDQPNGENEEQLNQRNNIVQLLVQQGKSLRDLRFFNGSNTGIDNNCLDELLRLNRNLHHVVLYKTTIADAVRAGITVASTVDLKQALDLLKFHDNNDSNFYSRHILEDIHQLLEAGISFDAHELVLRECLDLMLKKVEVLAKKTYDRDGQNFWSIKNVLIFCKFYASNLTPKKIQHVVSVMMANNSFERLSWCILGIPVISQAPGLDVTFLYKKIIDFLVLWKTAFSYESVLIMVDVLVTFHAKTTEEMRSRIGRDKDCIEGLRSILLELCPKYEVDDIEFMDVCRQVQAAMTILVDGSNFAIDNDSYLKVFDLICDCKNAVIKEMLLKYLKQMTYRVDNDWITDLTEKLDFQKFLSFLVEDLNLSYCSTGMKINLGVAVATLEVLEILLGQTNEEGVNLEHQLFLASRIYNRESHQIPVKRDGQEIYTSVDYPQDEWPKRMLAEINSRVKSITLENMGMFDMNWENTNVLYNVVNIRGELLTDSSAVPDWDYSENIVFALEYVDLGNG